MRKMYFPLMLLMSGCSYLDSAVGLNPDGSSAGPGLLDVASTTLNSLGVWGGVAAGAVGTAALWYRHFRILKAGKKDDNLDGVADDEQKK